MELAIGAAASRAGAVFIAYMHDLTARLDMERTREELERQLREAQKMAAIGQLTSVIGCIGLALDHDATEPDLRRHLERARRSGDRARESIQQMLSYARGARGEPQAVDIDELVEEVVSLLDATLPSTIQGDLELDRALPAVLVDPMQAAQALMNLCINARDAMGGHGMLTRLGTLLAATDLRCTSCNQVIAGPHVQLAVVDTGGGIPPQLLERIFEPFFSTKATGKGSGMGLATTHGILHQHGGHIVVDSTPGKGTCFSLLLPPLARDAMRRVGQSPALPEPAAWRLCGRMLMVDDNPAVVELMQDLLSCWGLQVAAWRESEAAFTDDPVDFDLALLDQTMPRLTGIGLAARLLRVRPDMPVVIHTGHSDSINEDSARAAGVRALLRKPIDGARLRAVLTTALGASGIATGNTRKD
jgi:nitrogen-specific signal transduction histidine kinase/ActR/RegA family two-component response regulator